MSEYGNDDDQGLGLLFRPTFTGFKFFWHLKFVLILTDFESDLIKRMYINGPGLISLAVNTLTNGNRHLTLN